MPLADPSDSGVCLAVLRPVEFGYRRVLLGLFSLMGLALIVGAADAAAAAPPSAPPPGTIEGIARDARGQPLAGVLLRLRAAGGRVARRATSDASGNYRLTGVAAGTYSLSGDKAGCGTAIATVAVEAKSGASADLTLAAQPPAVAEPAAEAAGPAKPAAAPAQAIEEITVIAKHLEEARISIQPQIGASTYTITRESIEAQPGGENNTLTQVVLQAPGVSQDSTTATGGFHVRNEFLPVQYRINGVVLPEGLSFFGQGLSPRFASSLKLITGVLPAEYGLRTSGIVDIQTKSGIFAPGGAVTMYGGSYGTMHPSAEYGGSVDGLNYYVSGDFLRTDRGIDAVTPKYNAIHDRSSQTHAFAYFDKIIDEASKVTLITGLFNGQFQIPNNPATPTAAGITFLNGVPVSAFNPVRLNERQHETSQFAVVSYLHSGENLNYQISGFTKYSTLHFRPDPGLADIAFNGIAQDAALTSFANGIQSEASYKIAADHTLRGGLLVTGEKFSTATISSVLLQDGTDDSGSPTFGSTPDSSASTTIRAGLGKTGWTYSASLQDEWRLTPDLTLNYGGRFDVVNQFVMGNQLSPRANAVWQATPTTVVHAGYAKLFTPPPFQLPPPANLIQFNNFNGTGLATSGATLSTLNSPLKIERAHYFDVGAAQDVIEGLKVGIDLYYKFADNGVDFGQFGAPVITIPFNYRIEINQGVELTTSYNNGPFSYYGNLAIGRQRAKGVVSSEFNFSPDDLAFVTSHGFQTDHSQLLTASAGVSYLWGDTRFSADIIAGTGLRTTRPGGPINGGSLPSYEQVNLGVSHRIEVPGAGPIKVRFDIINLLDEIYVLRSATALGAFAPAFAPRRSLYVGVTKEF